MSEQALSPARHKLTDTGHTPLQAPPTVSAGRAWVCPCRIRWASLELRPRPRDAVHPGGPQTPRLCRATPAVPRLSSSKCHGIATWPRPIGRPVSLPQSCLVGDRAVTRASALPEAWVAHVRITEIITRDSAPSAPQEPGLGLWEASPLDTRLLGDAPGERPFIRLNRGFVLIGHW